jgi:predicted NBD/HSP70 family sugar kinase
VDALVAASVVEVVGTRRPPGRGRPADVLALASGFGVVLLADVGVRLTRLTVADLGQQLLAETVLDLDIAVGPESAMTTVRQGFDGLLDRLRRPVVRTVVVGLPGPVDPARGRPVRPPIMPGWDDYPVARVLGEHYGATALVENDVNLCALGEARALRPDQSPLLFVMIDAGIGGGLVTGDGDLHHGADGAAGDIGHVRVSHPVDITCACGNINCVEAVASSEAVIRALAATGDGGRAPRSIPDLVQLIQHGDQRAVGLVRESAATIGEVVAMLVHCFNPARVVLGGPTTEATDDILAGVRAVVYQRALPLATRNLVLAHSTLGAKAVTAGATVLAIEHAISPAGLLAAGAVRRTPSR